MKPNTDIGNAVRTRGIGGAGLLTVAAVTLPACLPLLYRLMGIGLVVAERVRRGAWPTWGEAHRDSNPVLEWMIDSHFEPVVWIAALGFPFVLLAWVFAQRQGQRSAREFCGLFRRMVATAVIAIAAAWVLARVCVTGVY